MASEEGGAGGGGGGNGGGGVEEDRLWRWLGGELPREEGGSNPAAMRSMSRAEGG